MWHKVDDEVLGVADDTVKWLWNELGMPYRWVQRATLVAFVIGHGVLDVLEHHHLGWTSIILLGFVMMLCALQEYYMKITSPELYASMIATGRSMIYSRCCRLWVFASLVLDICFYFGTHRANYRWDIGHDLATAGCMWLFVAIPALGPREPRKVLTPKLAFAKL